MPFEGEQFDELLSGYLDNQLNEAELAVVEDALSRDPALRVKLDEFRQIRTQVKRAGEVGSTHQFSSDFASNVIVEAKRRAIEAGLPDSHHVLLADDVLRPSQSWRVPATVLGTIAALAAMILLAVYVPIWFGGGIADPSDAVVVLPEVAVPEEEPTETSPLPIEREPATVKYVGDSDFQIMYTLVIDMELSKEAIASEYIAGVFANSAITLKDPIVANAKLKEVLADARMIVQPEDENAGDAFIYFVHADTKAVGRVLETLYGDLQNVPILRMDLAFETPANRLMKRMAESSGQRFTVDDSIAAPLAADTAARISPFSGIGAQGKLVSSGVRRKSEAHGGVPGLGLAGDGKSAFLLLVRAPK